MSLPTRLALFYLGSDVHLPREGTCPLPYCGSQSQWEAELGPAGLGAWGAAMEAAFVGTHHVPGTVLGTSLQALEHPLSTWGAWGQAHSQRGNGSRWPGFLGPRLPPGLATLEPEP